MARRVTPAAASWLSRGAAVTALLIATASASDALFGYLVLQMAGVIAVGLVVSRWMPWLHTFAIGGTVFVLLRVPTAWAPVVIALLLVAAGLQLASDRGRDVTFEQLKPTWIAVAITGLIATLLAGRMLGPFNESPGTDSLPERPLEDMRPVEDGSNFLAELLGRGVSAVARWVGAGSEQVSGGSIQPPEPERDINWMRMLLVVAIVLIVMLLLWWAWRRWRPRTSAVSAHGDWAVRSLDETGRRVARDRLVSEDPASYGGQIELPTSNGRLARAGLLVSDRLYRPAGRAQTADEEAALRSELEGLADLPSAPTPPRRRPTTKQFAIAGAVLLLLGFGAFALWRGLSGESDEPTTESMLTAPATGADGYRWVLCAVDAVGDGSVETFESRGFVDSEASLVAIEFYGNGFGRTFVAVGDSPVSSISLGAADRNGWVYWPHESDPATAASVDMRELRSMNGVVAALGLEDAVTEGPVARDGELYQAWERPNQTQADGDLISFGDASVNFNRFLAASAHRVEVWADGDGAVEHLRVSLQEFGETAIELRFVDSVPAIEPPELGGRTRMNLFGDCPASNVAEPDMGWLGFESYDATVSTIANIAVDEQGQAYEYEWRADGEHESESLGVVQLDLGALFLLRANSIGEEEPTSRQVDVGAGGPVDMTVARVALDDSMWTSALRFDLVGGEVDVWERLGDRDCLYYSPLAIGSSSDGEWPGLGEEALSTWPDSVVVMADGKPWLGLEASEGSCLQLFVGKVGDDVQAVLLVFDGAAFRTVAPDGTPPDDVQAAQRRLQACVDGEVEIEEFGRCRQ